MGQLVRLDPACEFLPQGPAMSGRFAWRTDCDVGTRPGAAGTVASVMVEASPAGSWRVVLRDGQGTDLGTLELWAEGEKKRPAPEGKLDTLTDRQREILRLVAEGQAVKQIAAGLGISLKTVEFHKTRLMRRLGLRGTAELTRFAVANGLVAL